MKRRWISILQWFGLYPQSRYYDPPRIVDMAEFIFAIDPDMSQFTTILRKP